MKFIPRTQAPDRGLDCYYAKNPYYWSGYGMPNCTCYAYGRVWELLGQKPELSLHNAEQWYEETPYPKGQTPKLGAVAVWAKGAVGNNSDGAGHVAVVEEIYADGSVLTSNSAWKGENFYTARISAPGYVLSGSTFLGFIYPPYAFTEGEWALPMLRNGDKGGTVKALQALLVGYGYSCGRWGADGIFGTGTENALMHYQDDHDLEIDGICGPKSWASLLGVRE